MRRQLIRSGSTIDAAWEAGLAVRQLAWSTAHARHSSVRGSAALKIPKALISFAAITFILSLVPSHPTMCKLPGAEQFLLRVCIASETRESNQAAVVPSSTPELTTAQLPARARSLSELAREAEQKCLETAAHPPSEEEIMEAVDAACLLLQEEGTPALPQFRGSESPFIFGGTYIWIHDLSGVMVLHPIKHELEGLNLLGLRDSQGKRLFADMNDAVLESGSAWVTYHWPRPGEEASSAKRSYVKLCRFEGRAVVIGCGLSIGDEEGTDPLN